MEKEIRVCLIDAAETAANMTTEQIQDLAEQKGDVYSLSGFQEAYNLGEINTESFIFFLLNEQNEVIDCLHNYNEGICKTCGAVAAIHNAQNPTRHKAIRILEAIADKLGNEDIFDGETQGGDWYEFEDLVTEILSN